MNRRPISVWLDKMRNDDIVCSYTYKMEKDKYHQIDCNTMSYVKYMISGKTSIIIEVDTNI
jgi:hypothetical protein